MKSFYFAILTCLAFSTLSAQQVSFEEYDLDNGLHVILHQDNRVPTVMVNVMYHVGGKDEKEGKRGYAHFFEHLLFEGSKNIGRGEFMKIASAIGGNWNAFTTSDVTNYYIQLPSNKLEIGLWLESERMLHPVIDTVGVNTQREVVQEEKRLRYDNSAYGQLFAEVSDNMFQKHPYKITTIGLLEDLASGQLEDFQFFRDTYYVPNNAALVIAGDIDIDKTKKLVEDYFAEIPKGEPISRQKVVEDPITQTINDTFYDPNIQIPAIVLAYRTPGEKEKDAYALQMLSTYLSDGKSSVLYKKLVDKKKMALQVAAFNQAQEDYSVFAVFALPVGDTGLEDLKKEIDAEIVKVQNELISERDFQKLQNIIENDFVTSNSSVQGIALSLADYWMFYGDTNLINSEIDIYQSITREDLQRVAREYLNNNQRLELEYLPKPAESK